MSYKWRALLAVALVAVLSCAARHFHADDALIYARYIRNALAGHGLVFNAGEPVNALTSPLDSYLLLISSWLLRGRVLLAAWLLGAGLLAATALLAERYLPWAGVLIGGSLYFEIFLGMETALFMFLLLASVLLYVHEKWNWLPLLLALVILTRFEGGALALAVGWQMLRQRRWPRWPAFIPAFVAVAIYLCLNYHWYGKALPSSASAKFYHGISGYWGRWPFAFYHLPYGFYHPLESYIYTVPLALWLAWRGRRSPLLARWHAVVWPFLGILLTFYTLFNLPGYLWYYAPFVLFIILYASQGLPRSRWTCVGMAAVLVHTTVLGSILLKVASTSLYAPYPVLAAWINSNAAPNASVAAVETGTVGWYMPDHPVIDIVGLTTPGNARLLAEHDVTSWLELDKPDYVLVHTPPAVGEAAALASANYEQLPVRAGKDYLMRRIAGR